MSWFARSIANTLKLDDDDEENDDVSPAKYDHSTGKPGAESEQNQQQSDDPSSPTSPSRGVREDLSELTKTLSRQFWGVASFLAPPPQEQSESEEPLNEFGSEFEHESDPDQGGSDAVGPAGIRNDFAELGGRFRSGISKLSNNKAVSEITKIASNILQLGSDEEDDDSWTKGAVGVTEEVVTYARDIAMHPETWLDFPLPENEDDEDFDMSDAQQDHALAVEHLAPRLAALRIELCPSHMSETHFWKIYFILVHPKLEKEDAELLSTPQIVKARASLGQELRKRTHSSPQECNDIPNVECLSVPPSDASENLVQGTSGLESTSSATIAAVSDAEKHPDTNNKIQIVDKSVIEEVRGNETPQSANVNININEEDEDDDADDWLNEESTETHNSTKTAIPIENEDDVSFSDLEDDDDDDDVTTSYKKASSNSSDKDSQDWVQLKKSSADASKDVNVEKVNAKNSESKESNDWLDIDDIEVA
ncbi:uncharacterized protein LOC116013671 [Ipomoea triloba]|uniref:uncharacterized protein LOC116013671 n=1 Tax=Ipomoea triloba TaxID=35885 RepID=UPI00125CE6C3|nr:uncharacterized protein LOC116013671 [Ipomoea triloba]